MKQVVIIDYGAGNLRSAEKAFQLHSAELGFSVTVSGDCDIVAKADHIVLPGVGAFKDCMSGLQSVSGMIETLEQRVRGDGIPFMGICVGMQLLADIGLEHGETPGLGWIGGRIEKLAPQNPRCKIPHMGWNELTISKPHPVLTGIADADHAYFVHSYGFMPADPDTVLATTTYGEQIIPAVIGHKNIIATQFHPEKSQETGLELIKRFLIWDGSDA